MPLNGVNSKVDQSAAPITSINGTHGPMIALVQRGLVKPQEEPLEATHTFLTLLHDKIICSIGWYPYRA